MGGGDSFSVYHKLQSEVVAIYAGYAAFAALKADGSVVTWGNKQFGADSSLVAAQLSSGVASICAADNAFAALKRDGSVVAWGYGDGGGDSSSVANNVTLNIYSFIILILKNSSPVCVVERRCGCSVFCVCCLRCR